MFDDTCETRKRLIVVDTRAMLNESTYLRELQMRIGTTASLERLVDFYRFVWWPGEHRSIALVIDSGLCSGAAFADVSLRDSVITVGVFLTRPPASYEDQLDTLVADLTRRGYSTTCVTERAGGRWLGALGMTRSCSVDDHVDQLEIARARHDARGFEDRREAERLISETRGNDEPQSSTSS